MEFRGNKGHSQVQLGKQRGAIMLDPLFFDEDYRKIVTCVEREFALGLLKAVPELESHLEKGYFNFNSWNWPDGMGFMEELLRCCDRLVDHAEGKDILPRIFSYLEDMAVQLDSSDLKKEGCAADLPPELRAIDCLLFTFTDNPTGKDVTLRKLTPFMRPRINKMSCQI
jgi:hypothetical protein